MVGDVDEVTSAQACLAGSSLLSFGRGPAANRPARVGLDVLAEVTVARRSEMTVGP